MNREKKIYITPIKNGTALDHLKPGTAIKIILVLNLKNNKTTAAMNVESKRLGKKDIVFIEGKELNEADINKIALIGKGGTLNTIKNAKIVKKQQLSYPDFAEDIFSCINPNCVTNKEPIAGKFYITNMAPLKAKCFYCETEMNEEEITRLIK